MLQSTRDATSAHIDRHGPARHDPSAPWSARGPGGGALQGFDPGQTVLRQGEAPKGVPVVESGLVALSLRQRDGRRHIVFLAGPGDVLCPPGSAAIPADAEALAASQVRVHGMRDLERDESLCRRLNEQLRRQHERSLHHVFALGQREARQRLGWFIHVQADGRCRLDLPLSRQDIADYLGLTIETVSREFTRLRRIGAIAYQRNGSIAILRPHALFGNGA
ncbi:MAG: Crp/Fnr family transcriptional regulator [Bosea sp.]|jgi:CRP/FNR family transcriptional regulator|nr:Crp/Fnr family transcriptional regulator [Bosea sp. (in: a-proteobacteria)]